MSHQFSDRSKLRRAVSCKVVVNHLIRLIRHKVKVRTNQFFPSTNTQLQMMQLNFLINFSQ